MAKLSHWELCKKFKFDPKIKWYMLNPESILKIDTQDYFGFWNKNGSTNLGQTTRQQKSEIVKKKRKREKLCTLPFYCVNLKESKKKDKSLDLVRELKKLWNMKVTVILVVIGALGIVTK